jgi:hypothetical protein
MTETQHKCLQYDGELHSLIQKQIDVAKYEIHYENERYQGEREEERSDVILENVALEGHGFIPSAERREEDSSYINNNCFAYKQFVILTPDRPAWARGSSASGGG